jgi:hypothetical protein
LIKHNIVYLVILDSEQISRKLAKNTLLTKYLDFENCCKYKLKCYNTRFHIFNFPVADESFKYQYSFVESCIPLSIQSRDWAQSAWQGRLGFDEWDTLEGLVGRRRLLGSVGIWPRLSDNRPQH